MTQDFVYLNVSRLLGRYSNPSPNWHEIVRSFTATQHAFFVGNGLLVEGACPVWSETLILRFSDFTAEGRAFLKSQAVEKWLGACDRKRSVDAYKDGRGLERRLAKFRATQS